MRIGALVVSVVLVAACGGEGAATVVGAPAISIPDGFRVEVLADGFDGPTQIAVAPDGRLLVAELNGGERDGNGRVVAVALDAPDDRTVLVDGLLTPTGIAVTGDLLWIMEQRRLSVGPLDDGSRRTVVADDLAFNGRSQGTLTAERSGAVLYDTSGRETGDGLVAGSGTLWRIEGPDAAPVAVAGGLKHAYAHAEHPDGRLFVTEISDGRLDGATPPDELVVVRDGDDFGYPRCIGDRTPVVELGATAADCAGSPPSLALFEPGSTPTSVAVAPWDDSTLLVALWNAGVVVTVPAGPAAQPHTGEVFLGGVQHPQHLLALGDRLLVVDHAGGRILAVTAA